MNAVGRISSADAAWLDMGRVMHMHGIKHSRDAPVPDPHPDTIAGRLEAELEALASLEPTAERRGRGARAGSGNERGRPGRMKVA